MPELPPRIRVSETPVRAKASVRRRRLLPWLASSAAFAAVAAIMLIVALNRRGSEKSAPSEPGAKPSSTIASSPTETLPPQDNSSPAPEILVDDPDGELLWASPTAGAPLSLAYVPSGAQCLVHVRPASLASHPEGEALRAALGPWGQDAIARIESQLGCKVAEIDSLLLSIVLGGQGQIDACVRAELAEPVTIDELRQRVGGDLGQQRDRQYLLAGERAYFLASDSESSSLGSSRTLVAAPQAWLAELLASAGEAPPLVRDFEALAEQADADRLVTIVVAPKFLQAGGNELLTADAAPLHDAIRWLIDADSGAAALSAHWDDNFFVELRAVPALNVAPRRLASKLRQRIAAAPDVIEEQILAAPWHPYGRKILARFPGMLRAMARYCRAGESDRHALVRCYLPVVAGHNLIAASELLLTQPHIDSMTAAESTTPAAEPTLPERLAARTSLTFAKETLERALELLADDLKIEIFINGADLQLEGITKNQSFSLDARNQPAHEILTEILLRANPDRTATGPGDVRQKLVYVLQPGDSPGLGRIIVTTRTAAEKRRETLPAAFVVKTR